jgi:hypothetical protein
MTCKLNACTEKSTHQSSNTPHMIVGSVVVLGLFGAVAAGGVSWMLMALWSAMEEKERWKK